jgi:hypothetical protein
MKTRSLYLVAAAGALALFALVAPEPTSGQNLPANSGAAAAADARLEALIEAVAAQNAQLAKNQAEMDAKIDRISELVRQARIYAARGGKGSTK